MKEHLPFLKQFAEGEKNLDDWSLWWQANAESISATESRKCYLSLKHEPFCQVCTILTEFEVQFRPDRSKCEKCGTPLFSAVPHVTTVKEIIEFARNSRLPNASQIIAERWIHPGQHCPNGCTYILRNYGSCLVEDDAE